MKPSYLFAIVFAGLGLTLGLIWPLHVLADDPLDVVFGNSFQPNQVCLGDGLGAFSCNNISPDLKLSRRIALGDVNGDRRLDAVIANVGQPNLVCLGDALGGFVCSDVSPDFDNSFGVALGDVNGDGQLDAVFANIIAQRNRVCLGNGSGGFSCSNVSSQTNDSFGVALADINEDGRLDAVFANVGQRNRVCLGSGSGGFACGDVSPDTNDSYGVMLGKVDGDSWLDAVFANEDQPNRVCLGDGTGGFSCNDVSPDTESSFGVALGQVDGDGQLDAVFGNSSQTNRICLGDGIGGFSCGDVSTDTNRTGDVALGDVNGDDQLDAVFANGFQHNRVCLGNGSGGFTCGDVSPASYSSFGVALGAVNPPILDLTKTVDWTTPLLGQSITYTISVMNSGGTAATGAVVSDTVPSGLNLAGPVSVQGGGGSAGTPPTLASGLTISPGTAITITFPVTVSTGLTAGTVITNTAAITSLEVTTPVTDIQAITVRTLDLGLSKTNDTGDNKILLGDAYTWTLTVSNSGVAAAQFLSGQTILTDTLPNSGATYGPPRVSNAVNITNSLNISCALISHDLSCRASAVTVTLNTPSSGFEVTIPVTPTTAGVFQNPRSGGMCRVDPDSLYSESNEANNDCSNSVTVLSVADLVITKTTNLTATPGLPLTYNILVANAGPMAAASAVVSDTFTQLGGVSWGCTPSGGASCPTGGTGNISHTVSLPAGDKVTFVVSGTVDSSAMGQLVNSASVTSVLAFDPAPNNNVMSTTTTLVPAADLTISKGNERNYLALPNPIVTYTISLRNLGPSAAGGATISDTIPSGLFTGDDWSWSCSGNAGATCNAISGTGSIYEVLPVLPPGGYVTYIIVAELASGSIVGSNTVTVSTPAGITDPNPNNNMAVSTEVGIYMPLIHKQAPP